MPQTNPAYRRILLKLSGESLLGNQVSGFELEVVRSVVREIKEIHDLGVEIAIMIGGGNIFRGIQVTESGMHRVSADHMGLMATVINGIALQEVMALEGLKARLVSAIAIESIAEVFVHRDVNRYLEEKRVVIFSAGLGSPYFTTDTAAALRALEIDAEVIMKATKVDGVYSADPMKDKQAKKFTSISYLDVIQKGLKVMDTTAISLCKDNHLPIVVFNIKKQGNLKKAVLGDPIGTRIA